MGIMEYCVFYDSFSTNVKSGLLVVCLFRSCVSLLLALSALSYFSSAVVARA